MAKSQTPPVAINESANDIAVLRKIKAYLFRAILQSGTLTALPEKAVLENELRRALNATASFRAKLGDLNAYTEIPPQ